MRGSSHGSGRIRDRFPTRPDVGFPTALQLAVTHLRAMGKTMRPAGVLGLCVLMAACVTVSKTVLTDEFRSAPVPPGQVDVLLASMGDTIPSDCVRVAILHASGDEDVTDEGDMLEKLREEAGKLGANTVFVQRMEDPGTGERIVSGIFGTTADRDSESLALHCPRS